MDGRARTTERQPVSNTEEFLAGLHAQAKTRHAVLRNPNTFPSDMRTADATLLDRAKREIDLPGFLGQHGWQGVAGHDGRNARSLRGEDGSHIVVSRASDGHWVWFRDGERRGGSIVDAVQQLLGIENMGRTMGILRRALASPPPPLTVATGSQRVRSALPAPPSSPVALGPLGERGRTYLIEQRHLAPETINRFQGDLMENTKGSVRARHNVNNDGEERGPDWKSFVGGRDLGTGRGRSIWRARPTGCTTPRFLIVAESFISALSAWESLGDANLQRACVVVSTAGSIAAAGAAKLEKLIAWVRGMSPGKEVRLFDASDNGETHTEQRTAYLADLVRRSRVTYERLAPPSGKKDWNDALGHAKAQAVTAGTPMVDATIHASETASAYIHVDAEFIEEHGDLHAQEQRPRGREI